MFTHTFIYVKNDDGTEAYFAYGPKPDENGDYSGFGFSPLAKLNYSQDLAIIDGDPAQVEDNLKAKILVEVPDGMTSSEFDNAVIDNANSFGNDPNFTYNATTNTDFTGNCNTSTTTILSKSGVGQEQMDEIEYAVPGVDWGFGTVRPWTKVEQAAAIAKHRENPPPRLGTQL